MDGYRNCGIRSECVEYRYTTLVAGSRKLSSISSFDDVSDMDAERDQRGCLPMRWLMRFASFSFVIFAFSIALAHSPTAAQPYSLSVSATSPKAVMGTPVKIAVTLENTSAEDFALAKSKATERGELTYDVAVVTGTGAAVPLTEYGKALHGEPTTDLIIIRSSVEERTLKPHEKIVDTIVLNKIFQLTPGDYIVRVQNKQFALP